MRKPAKLRQLGSVSEGWRLATGSGKPVKAEYSERVYWFLPTGQIYLVIEEAA